MSRIAIDIVLLPPEKIMDLVIAINKEEAKKGNSKGELNKVDFLPHLSLAMGTIEEKNLEKVEEIVIKTSKEFNTMNLILSEPYYVISADNKKAYALRVKGKKLQRFHELLMRRLDSFLSFDAKKEDIYNQESEPTYVNGYKEIGCFRKYEPHITVRCKELSYKKKDISFFAKRVAVCHLGISTTCRKILFETELN
jgi:hypothetical protein